MAKKEKYMCCTYYYIKKKSFLAAYGWLDSGQPGMVATMAVILKAQKKVHIMHNAMQNVHQDDTKYI